MAEKELDKERAMGYPGIVLQRREPYDQVQGYILPPRDVAIGKYRRMAQTDATVAACLEFVTTSALSRLGDYQHDDPHICEFIRLNFELLQGSFVDTCRELLSCLWAGFSVAEIVTEVRGGMVWLHSLPLLPCETVTFHINEDTDSIDYGQIDGIIQRPYQQGEARLPVDKCVIMRNLYSGAVNYDPYGMSRLQVVLSAWDSKEKVLRDWTEALGKYATPLMKYKLYDTEATVKSEGTGQEIKAYQAAAEQLRGWTNKSNGFIYGEGNDLEFIFPPSNIGDSFQKLTSYLDRVIMRGLLIPSLLFEAGDVGSYALGQEHMELYQQGLNALLSNLTETLLEQLVRPLITVNFGEQGDWGRFDIRESKTELHSWAQLLQAVAGTGAIQKSNLDDINYMRSKLGLDAVDETEITEAELATAIARADGGDNA